MADDSVPPAGFQDWPEDAKKAWAKSAGVTMYDLLHVLADELGVDLETPRAASGKVTTENLMDFYIVVIEQEADDG